MGSRLKKDTRLKGATPPRERRAAGRRALRAVAPFRRARCAERPPSARFAPRMGLSLFCPFGANLKFPPADFEGKRDAYPPFVPARRSPRASRRRRGRLRPQNAPFENNSPRTPGFGGVSGSEMPARAFALAARFFLQNALDSKMGRLHRGNAMFPQARLFGKIQ